MEQRAARQVLEAERLMGVDVVPAGGAPDRAVAPAETESRAREKAEALAALRAAHDAECPHCTATTAHTRTVFGEGNADADLMFVGEAPGAEEDRTGRPFVGRAGKKLDDMINAMGMRREDVYIANILKSRPPNNRTPLADEVSGCAPYLSEQIRIIDPRVIVALGGPSAKYMLGTETGITRLRGQWGRYMDDDLEVDVMPTFHPAYLLRNYTRETRERVWSDLQAVMDRLGAPSGPA
jgi:DNA polymerase